MAKVYDSATGTLLHLLINPTPAEYNYFGLAVAISGSRVVVAANNEETMNPVSGGIVYVYDLAGGTPTLPTHTLNLPDQPPFYNFVYAVGISGTRVVVGAATHYGDGDAGRVYVYDLTTPSSPIFVLHNPTSRTGDDFGRTVAIAGTRVVVGAPYDDTGTNDAGSAYVYDLGNANPNSTVLILNNPELGKSYSFGFSVAISGTRVVVGAPFDNFNVNDGAAAYVYDLTSATPSRPVTTLRNPSPEVGNDFGRSVAISSTRVIVGVSDDRVGSTDNAGSAYVFDLATAVPTLPLIKLTNPNPAWYEGFGDVVAISGAHVAVGARGETFFDTPGNAYLYDLAGAIPSVPFATLNSPSPAANSGFGASVAISGTRVVVGAYSTPIGLAKPGSALVYDLASATPTVPAFTLENPRSALSAYFGYSVAISGSRVAVGAFQGGIVSVFDLASATPTLPIITLTNRSYYFGSCVAISGTRVVVGAWGDNTGAEVSGRAYVFDLASATPGLPSVTFDNPTPTPYGRFGFSVAISGTRVVVGAFGDNTGAERAYVYELASAMPAVPAVTLTNPSASLSGFGYSVAISDTRVVVGAYEARVGVSGAGSAYVYDLASAMPAAPIATLNNPSPAKDDNFGYSVAISGSRIVVGAYRDDIGANNAGTIYGYDLNGSGTTLPNPNPGSEDRFGSAVAVDGSTIVAGVPLDDIQITNRGAAYVFGPLQRKLNITRTTPGSATISWPINSPGFRLQHTERLAPANWLNAPSFGTNPVTVPLTNSARFYRLFQP